MGSWTNYKGLNVPDSATGDGGINLTDDLKTLADRAPYATAADPTTSDDSAAGFIPGSQWLNTSTLTMWVCTDNSSGAAKWRSLYRRIDNAIVLAPEAGVGGSDNRAIQLDEGGNARGVNAIDFQRIRWADQQVASGNGSIILNGVGNSSGGIYSSASGICTNASGYASHTEGGRYTTASGRYSHAQGRSTYASGCSSHAEGISTSAAGESSHAEGLSSTSGGYAAHSEGRSTNASGAFSHAEGFQTLAQGNASHAEGTDTMAIAGSAHAEGSGTVSNGYYSHAEGLYTTAGGGFAKANHAEGVGSSATGFCSSANHAEGTSTYAGGSYAEATHAEGISTKAIGQATHAEGSYSYASGNSSHAGGKLSRSHLNSQWARASGGHSAQTGTAQFTLTSLFRLTTDNSITELTIGGSSPGSTTRYLILDGQTLSCFINIVGRKENGGTNDHGSFLRQVLIRREGSTTALVGSVQTIGTDINPAGWGGVTITADDTNESLKIEVTGAASTNIRWTATVMASEAADAAI
jgi:hypothetical protein